MWRFLATLRETRPLPVRRIETPAGEEAQVDFGTGAWVISNGKRKRPWVLRVVLSHSRKAYCEAVWRQSTDAFIRCLENAFAHFGGVPKRIVIDNLKAAVARADWYDPEVHPKLQSFAKHYGTVFMPTKPYTPQHKGKVESGVKYVKRNALKGRTFNSLTEQNDFLLDWETRVADQRIHRTTKKQVAKLFQDSERAALLSLPPDLYRSIFDAVRDLLHDEAFEGHDKVMAKYLKPDLLILDDMGMKQLPKRSGEYLFEIIMRRHELKSTIMTSNRPLEDWGKLIGDVPTATAILDRLLEGAEIIQITGKSYRIGRGLGKRDE